MSKLFVSEHVIEETLRIDDEATYEEVLKEAVGRWTSTPLDFKKPLWRAIAFQDENGNSALLAQLHHVYADGHGCVRMLLTITDALENGTEGVQHATPKNDATSKMGVIETFWQYLFSLLYLPFQLHVIVYIFLLYVFQILKFTFFNKKAFKTQMKIQKTVAWTNDISLDDVKFVKNHFKATVNDVLVTALMGGIRNYLVKNNKLEENELLCGIPVSMRKLDDWSLGNKTTITWIFFPTTIPDSRKLLLEVQRRLNVMKRSPEVWLSFNFSKFIGHFLNNPWGKSFLKWYRSKSHATMTNIPGPRNKIHFGSAGIATCVAIVPQPQEGGLGIAIFSYNDKVSISIVTDKSSGNPQEMIDCVVAYFDEMRGKIRYLSNLN